MKAESIRRHLRPYSIAQARSTTIAHAFASAIAPVETPTIEQINAAVEALGQDPSRPLRCVYCDAPGETWDHLEALVLKRQISGHGHTLGNLVPSCRNCNSAKGNKPWRDWVQLQPDGQQKLALIEDYVRFCRPAHRGTAELERLAPGEMTEYDALRKKIIELFVDADRLAASIQERANLAARSADVSVSSSVAGLDRAPGPWT